MNIKFLVPISLFPRGHYGMQFIMLYIQIKLCILFETCSYQAQTMWGGQVDPQGELPKFLVAGMRIWEVNPIRYARGQPMQALEQCTGSRVGKEVLPLDLRITSVHHPQETTHMLRITKQLSRVSRACILTVMRGFAIRMFASVYCCKSWARFCFMWFFFILAYRAIRFILLGVEFRRRRRELAAEKVKRGRKSTGTIAEIQNLKMAVSIEKPGLFFFLSRLLFFLFSLFHPP